jgi:Phage protein Gp138 N-terminal domain
LSTTSTAQAQLTASQVNRSESAQWRSIVRQALIDTRVASPAFLIEDMDTASQTVTVQIAIQERVRTLQGPRWYDIGPLFKVPIVIPRGGGFSLTVPLKKGNEGMLVFCDCCFDQWWQNGQTGAPVADNAKTASGTQQQVGMHRHEVNDCGFYPGFYSQPNVLTNYSTVSMQLRSDDGVTVVDVAGNKVTITSPEVDIKNTGTPLALMNDDFFQWWTGNIYPFLVAKGYAGPTYPSTSETTVLKGQ